jgi:hypothetical protein
VLPYASVAAFRTAVRDRFAAIENAETKTTTGDLPARSFTGLLDHLATLTRNHQASPATTRPASTCSPCPPPLNAEHSNSSAPRSH